MLPKLQAIQENLNFFFLGEVLGLRSSNSICPSNMVLVETSKDDEVFFLITMVRSLACGKTSYY
jgi:hypothetical protein